MTFFTPVYRQVRNCTHDILHLFFPTLCAACEGELPSKNSCFCLSCQLKLQPSDMYKQQENEFTLRFWGRLPVKSGASLYYFNRRSPIQKAFHHLKYHNQPGIGIQLGQLFGRLIRQSPFFAGIDVVVPVPLHPKKERIRGYNQSEMIARGLSEVMEIKHAARALKRNTFNSSQTQKRRLDRFNNVSSVFSVANPAVLAGQHVLLVDDVLTTGATLEQCGKLILEVPGTQLSMVTLAIAML